MKTFLKILKFLAILVLVTAVTIVIMRFVNQSNTKKLEAIKPETLDKPIYAEINREDPLKSNIPGVNITKVEGKYINGYHLLPDNLTRNGVIVNFGGSEGSSDITTAAKLAKEGYEVYSMYFFGQPNQQKELVQVPLDFFEELNAEIAKTSKNPKPLTMIGASKGAELTLLLASKYPDDIDNIVLYAPSAYVFQGLSQDRMKQASSWTYKGEELPYLSFRNTDTDIFAKMIINTITNKPTELEPLHSSVVRNAENLEAVTIDVSPVKAKTLMFAGKEDKMWNSYEMAKTIEQNLKSEKELVAYDNVGHLFFGPPVVQNLYMGGEYEANAKAGVDSDQKLFETLDSWTK